MKLVDRSCLICGRSFRVQHTRARHGRGKHCSPACQYEARRRLPKRLIEIDCAGCGARFTRNPSFLKIKKGAGRFCSRACRDRHRVGELHPQYLGTREEKPDYGTNWQAQKRRARRRDGCCMRCGAKDGPLAVHHKIPIRLWADKNAANDLGNLVSLCHSCHRTVEAESTWTPVDVGVIQMRTGGAAYELAKEKGMLPNSRQPTIAEILAHGAQPLSPQLENELGEIDAILAECTPKEALARIREIASRPNDPSIARARLHHVEGREFVPRESLRAAEPPKQTALFRTEAE